MDVSGLASLEREKSVMDEHDKFKGFAVVHDPMKDTRRYNELLRAGKREEARALSAEISRKIHEWVVHEMVRADEEAMRAANDDAEPAPPKTRRSTR